MSLDIEKLRRIDGNIDLYRLLSVLSMSVMVVQTQTLSYTQSPLLQRIPLNGAQRMNVASYLVEAIDETLELLGKQTPLIVYDYLEKNFRLKKEEIPARPGAFLMGLSNLFGTASKDLERIIVKRLYEKLGIIVKPTDNLSLKSMYAQLQRR
jgi:hypothetical protein